MFLSATVSIRCTVVSFHSHKEARWKQFRVGPAKIGWSAEGASKLGGPGACSPGKF